MSDKLDFSIPERKKKLPVIFPVILIILILCVAVNALGLFIDFKAPAGSGKTKGLSPGQQKEIALRLQKNSVYGPAIDAWKDYLAMASSSDKDRAAIWYTIGKLYQEDGDYEMALDSFYKSEAIYENEDLKTEISRRVQDSLEYLGKFAALRYEMDDRLGLNEGDSGTEVLAAIGPEKITRADLDRKIEETINLQLAQYAAFMDREALNKQKEELFKQYAGEEGQQQMLNQYVVEEILYRKAREEKLAEEVETRALLKDTERKVLAQQLVSKRMGNINISEDDLKAYYESQKGDYIEEGIQKGFGEVKNDVYSKLLSQKQQEMQQQLIEELRRKYNVIINPSQLKKDATVDNEK